MRMIAPLLALLGLLAPGMAAAAIPCSDLPQAEEFVSKLRPGPNTRAAQRHLDAAKHAQSEKQCSAELRQVDKYARRSLEADKRAASAHKAKPRGTVQCADALHQNRPGGSDYHGPPVAGCSR